MPFIFTLINLTWTLTPYNQCFQATDLESVWLATNTTTSDLNDREGVLASLSFTHPGTSFAILIRMDMGSLDILVSMMSLTANARSNNLTCLLQSLPSYLDM